ncbi:MAG TPA: ABC-type transport auxiliary lipoprotein family protein [Steroidobacteraceae bacterium]|jgi:uncharacterized lipoprotein YmbA
MKLPLWTLMVALLAGCRSLPGPHYYSLDTVAPGASPTETPFVTLIQVRHISLPHELDHLGLTHHAGPTQLVISDTDQWSAPLTDLIQGTMTRDLGARLGFDHVVAPDALPVAPHPDPEQRGSRGSTQALLDLDFVTLAANETCAIDMQVNWTLSVPGAPARRGTAHLTAPASACPAGLPAALSSALGALADQLAQQFTTS